MKRIPLLLLPLLASFAPQDPTPQEESPATSGQDATGEARETEKPDLVRWARAFRRHWPKATYRVLKNGREVGTYVQENRITKYNERELLLFSDELTTGSQDGYKAQTTHLLAEDLPTRLVQANTKIDGIKLTFAGGRVRGQALMKAPVDLPIEKVFVTETDLLRGAPRVARVKGAEVTLPFLDLSLLPDPGAVTEGTLRCQGEHELELNGETLRTWKYRWNPARGRPTFFWYGEQGELLRRERRSEVWELKGAE